MSPKRTDGYRKNNNFPPRSQKIKEGTNSEQKLTGIITINGKGVGLFRHETLKEPAIIEKGGTANALHGDTVEIQIIGKTRDGIGAKVLKVLSRAKETYVGVLVKYEDHLFLQADNYRIHVPFLINKGTGNLKDKALVKFISWGENEKYPSVEIIEVIGKSGVHETEMQAIVLDRGFTPNFPPEVEREAEKIKEEVLRSWNEEVKKRRDFRNIPTCTIDPVDAKDFDDAISFEYLPDGNYQIGVHIADVSHFVREGTLLDDEAKKRGTSIYLVDRTIPMLPEVLSNDLCSLNPNEEKLSFSAVFTMNKNAEVISRWFGKTVIKSDKRFTYEEAQNGILSGEGSFGKELQILNGLAKKMLFERTKRGAISFETDEVKFELDKNGVPLRVIRKVRFDAHKLVEEFMLLANREVATFIETFKKKDDSHNPLFLYRIHDVPDNEKISELALFVKALGHELPIKGHVTGKDLNALFKRMEGEASEGLIKTAAIRSMAKAIYSLKNIGHFGLAFDYYTHFTSPIRRYPDTMVHRLLEQYLSGKDISRENFSKYEKLASQTTESEIRASEAERESIKLKQVEYMSQFIGKTFKGKISGVTEWGMYVEDVETKSEGMIALRNIKDDFYILDRKNYCLIGEKTKKKFSLGDIIEYRVSKADPEKRLLDFELVK